MASLIATARGRVSDQRQQDRQKADYLYMEAKRHALQSRPDAYFDLMDYALKLNPDDSEIGMDLGIYYLQLDSMGSTRGLDLMKRYVDQHPDDLYNGYTFASVAQSLGRADLATDVWRRLHESYPDREGVTMKYADILRRSGNAEKMQRALELYDTLAITGGDPTEIAAIRSTVFMQLGDTASVINEVHKLLDKSPRSSNYNLFAGNIYNALLKSDSAIVFFNRAIEADPTNGVAYYARANYYNQRNDSVAYDREVFDALQQPDLDLEVKLAMLHDYVGKLYTDSLQQPRITELFEKLNDQYPHQVDISNLYADYLIAVRDWAGAAEQANHSLELEPADQKKWAMLASLYLQMRDFDNTVDAASRGIHYFPDDANLYQLKALGYSGANHYRDAINTFRDAIDMVMRTDSTQTSTLSDIYTGLGDTYYQNEENDSAFMAYEKALEYNPANLLALNNAAYYMACEGKDLDHALEMIGRVTEAKPNDSTSLDTYAWVLFKMKNYDEARAAIDDALANDSDPSSELYEHAGDIYFMDGEPDQALDFWNKALDLDPGNDLLKRKVKHKTYFYK